MSEEEKQQTAKEAAEVFEKSEEKKQEDKNPESHKEHSEKKESKKEKKIEEAEVQIEQLKKELAEIKDSFLRKAADFDNYRKRSIKEKQEAIDYANANLLADLVTVIDDFERAIKAGSSSDLDSFKQGVVMIKDKMVSLLDSKYDLKGYESLNKPFDPTIHEALGSVQSPDVTEPTVGEVYLKGYKLKGRVVRVAKVMVKIPVKEEKVADNADVSSQTDSSCEKKASEESEK